MEDKKFSVHKSMVLSNRKALALYLFKINRADDIPKIMALVKVSLFILSISTPVYHSYILV